jgi:hypothetical protein
LSALKGIDTVEIPYKLWCLRKYRLAQQHLEQGVHHSAWTYSRNKLDYIFNIMQY